MTFDQLVQRRMLLLVTLMLMLLTYIGGIGSVGINKTVGSAWDITNFTFYAKNGSWIVFIVGYAILALLKYRTHKVLSIVHLILITLIFISTNILTSSLIMILTMLSIVIFILNFVWSIMHRKAS